MNALINTLVTASAKGGAWLLVWSWQAAVLLACVWVGLKIFRAKSPALRHQVWLFGLIAVATMPILSGVVRTLPLPQPNNKALSYAVEFPRLVVTNDAAPVIQNPAPAANARPSAKRPIILGLSFTLWLAGALIYVMKAAINGVRLRRLRAGARVISLADLECDESDFDALRAGKVSLTLSDEIRSPILLGVARPMIVFPADIGSWTSPEERCAMLRHELAHVERRDHYINLFQCILGSVFFFHPLARYACRQLTVEREMACDDQVVGSGAEAEVYAESIVKVAERSILLAGAPGGAYQLAFFGSRQILERRIEMILNNNRARVIALRWKYLIAPAALIAIVAWMLLPARLTKQGLAQKATTSDIEELAAKYMGDSRNFDDLVEMALTNPDPEMRQKAILRLHILEGDGSVSALFKLYNHSNDPIIKGMVIHSLRSRKASEQLAMIAEVEPEPEFRQMAEAHLKENTEEMEIEAANCTTCHVSDKTAFTLKMIGDRELNEFKTRGNHANLVKYVSWLNGPPPSPLLQNPAPDPWALVVKISHGGAGYNLNAIECPSLEDLSQKLYNALNGRPDDKKTVFVIAPETIADEEMVKVFNAITAAGGLPMRSPK